MLLSIIGINNTSISAQIGINTESPDQSTVLDIKATDKGILIPSMDETQKNAIVNPAEGLMVYDTDLKCISLNTGTEAAPKWICLTQFNRHFFMMPSINIETAAIGTTKTIDMYQQYKDQFDNPLFKSTSAPAKIPTFNADQLYYYITYFDDSILNIDGIDQDGKMTYTVKKKANWDTYMNIIFVIK